MLKVNLRYILNIGSLLVCFVPSASNEFDAGNCVFID